MIYSHDAMAIYPVDRVSIELRPEGAVVSFREPATVEHGRIYVTTDRETARRVVDGSVSVVVVVSDDERD